MKRMGVLSRPTSVNATSVFKDIDVTTILSIIHGKYILVPADKAQNNIQLNMTIVIFFRPCIEFRSSTIVHTNSDTNVCLQKLIIASFKTNNFIYSF